MVRWKLFLANLFGHSGGWAAGAAVDGLQGNEISEFPVEDILLKQVEIEGELVEREGDQIAAELSAADGIDLFLPPPLMKRP